MINLDGGIVISQGWNLMPAAIYDFFAGMDAGIAGIWIISLNGSLFKFEQFTLIV